MRSISLILIFGGLALSLHQHQEKTVQIYTKAAQKAVLSTVHTEGKGHKGIKKVLQTIMGLLIVHLVLGIFIPIDQRITTLLIGAYCGGYYVEMYMPYENWFLDQQALWVKGVNGPIGFENIVGYEWYEYSNKLLLRVQYKGRGIMLIKKDLRVAHQQKESVSQYLNQHMAGL